MLKILRILKFFKVHTYNEFLNRFNEFFKINFIYVDTKLKILSYYMYFFGISHILTCILIFLGTIENSNWIII